MKFFKPGSISFKKSTITKVLNILSLFFAIITIIFGTLLYSKRKILFDNNQNMASTLKNTSEILDKQSGTRLSRDANISLTEQPNNNQKFLYSFKLQVNNVINQRNELGSTLASISKHFSGKEAITTDKFTNLSSYKVSTKALIDTADKSNQMLTILAENVIKLSSETGIEIKDQTAFKEGALSSEQYNSYFSQISEKITKQLNSLKEKEKELKTSEENLASLQSKLNEYMNVDEDLKELIKEKEQQATNFESKTKTLSQQIDDYKKKLQEAISKNKINNLNTQSSLSGNDITNISSKIHGEVIKYDKRWGTVIINLGSQNKITLDIEGKKKIVNAPIIVGNELLVARNDKFIARVKVNQVHDNYSIASITFPKSSQIEPGDIVFFPSTPTGTVQ